MSNEYLTTMNMRQVLKDKVLVRPVWYMAHPVAENVETGERGPQHFMGNIARARRWLAWLKTNDRSRVWIAPWIDEVVLCNLGLLTYTYDEALQDDEEVVKHLDGIIMVGGKITENMTRERRVNDIMNRPEINWSIYKEPWAQGSAETYQRALELRYMNV